MEIFIVLLLIGYYDIPIGVDNLILGRNVMEKSIFVTCTLNSPSINQTSYSQIVKLWHHWECIAESYESFV